MKLSRTETDSVSQVLCNGVFSILHTWRDFGEKHIILAKIGIPFANRRKRFQLGSLDTMTIPINC